MTSSRKPIPIDEINFVASVSERDIDMLLLEELHCSARFREWISTRVLEAVTEGLFVGAWHSVTNASLGESDLIFMLEFEGIRKAILIENKIDAVVQPDQANRYQSRGRRGIEEKNWHLFRTCMIAPQRYLDSTLEAAHYDAVISYEDLRVWYDENGAEPERSSYKSKMLIEAIEQNRRGYLSTPHAEVPEFWLKYWNLVTSEYPQLDMRRPSLVPAGSDFPELRSNGLVEGRRIVHKWRHGYVDLEIGSAGVAVAELQSTYASALPVGAEILQTGKSASIRFCVPSVDRFAEFNVQVEAVRQGLDRAVELLELSKNIKGISA